MVPFKYVIPSRTASTLGYGALRPDGRSSERRRPASSTLGTPQLKAEAKAIPRGTGAGLDDRELMILCFLPPLERHRRASKIFNPRGEWYHSHKHMTVKSDEFLEMCKMPRMAVPRHLGDRPGSRNVAQVLLEEAEVAKSGVVDLNGGLDYQTWRSNICRQRSEQKSASATVAATTCPVGIYGPIVRLNAVIVPHLIEEDIFKYLWRSIKEKETKLPITIKFTSMSFQDFCTLLMLTFLCKREPGIPEMYIDTVFARWTDFATGQQEFREVFEHNWKDEIVLFLTQHPAHELTLGFGLALAEWVEEDAHAEVGLPIEKNIPIDPMLLGL